MILILSEHGDISSLKVSKWLNYLRCDYLMITERSKISDINITISNSISKVSFRLNGEEVELDQITYFWYRRGEVIYEMSRLGLQNMNEDILSYLSFEIQSLIEFIIIEMENRKKSVGSCFKSNSNKLVDLKLAINAGFSIPSTNIIDSRKLLQNICTKGKEKITKVIARPIDFRIRKDNEEILFNSLTNVIDYSIHGEEHFFSPSLIQDKIEKKYEIRIFFFDVFLWPMCIFSQKNSKTAVDFRNYDKEVPNRCVPYNLPNNVKTKVKKFISLSGLSTGSIDLIVDTNNEYIFLEVNPDGQFDFVSHDCNYYIEKKIAEYYAS